ncbi:MAG: aminotransferase class V-fold PLP-dependent enzyme [Phycisphaeraceae bacterium]|nr:aminotransferase class V-fold PLP-dependent enzyme [Phycisphaeraceae bacterium]
MIYLDNNATTAPSAAVIEEMSRALGELWHNPSSIHRPGQAARQAVDLARKSVAALIGARPREITFTGSGTESIVAAIVGSLRQTSRRVVATTAVEHNAVRELMDDLVERDRAERVLLPLDSDGRVDLHTAASLLNDQTAVVSVQWCNNETGVIQPVEELSRLARSVGAVFHCDATQWVGKMPTSVGTAPMQHGDVRPATAAWTDVDVLTFSPHKFHGPKGIGVIWTRPGTRLRPIIFGSQELGRRGGTENVPGILGAGIAAKEALAFLADPSTRAALAQLRDRFERMVLDRVHDAVLNKPKNPFHRMWNTASIGFPALEAEALLLLLSERGVCASAGSACSSGSLEASPVLLAMGVPPLVAHGTIRFSICRETTERELAEAAAVVGESVAVLKRSMASVRA